MTTYHAAIGGSDAGAGSIGDPFLTPKKATDSVASSADKARLNRGDSWDYTTHTTNLIMTLDVDGSDGSPIVTDDYGTGNIPELDFEWNNVGDYSATVPVTGDWNEITNIRWISIGGQTAAPGSRCIDLNGCNNSVTSNCEWDGVSREPWVVRGLTGNGPHEVADCSVTNGGIHRTYGNGGTMVSASNLDGTVDLWFHGNTFDNNDGETIGPLTCLLLAEDNEIFHTQDIGIYFHASDGDLGNSTARRNLIYGDTNSETGIALEVETFITSARAAKHSDIHVYFNLIAGCASGGIDWSETDTSIPDPIDEIRLDHNTLVDNDVQFRGFNRAGSATNSSVRNNISMPLSVGTTHTNAALGKTGVSLGNYWDDSIDSSVGTGWTDGSDVVDTTITLAKTSGWQAATALGDITAADFVKDIAGGGADIGYAGDYLSSSIPADNNQFGALFAPARIMGSVAGSGGLAGPGGIAGPHGGLAN